MLLGVPADEYVDVTGDGVADVLLTSRTVHITDPQQPGYLGLYKLGLRTLSGTSVLMWSTPSNQRWYTLAESGRLDTADLAARIHYKQLSWTDPDQPTEFWLLERPFGPAITREQDGWFGTGAHYDGTMVMRSANERGTGIAAFAFELPFPYGRVTIKVQQAVGVPNGFGDEGDPVPTEPKVRHEFEFEHVEDPPQLLIPAGLPPDERVNLNSDEVDDVVITGHKEHWHGTNQPGYYVRGISPLPGTMLLLTKEQGGALGFFRLRDGEVLTPERLATGLAAGTLWWASGERERVFFPVMRHPFGMPDQVQEWSFEEDAFNGALVFRTTEYTRPIIGTIEITGDAPGGVFGAKPQTWVEEGQVLELR